MVCAYPWYTDPITRKHWIGDVVFKNLFKLIREGKVDPNWGGYIIASIVPDWIFSWLYYGDPDTAKANAQALMNLNYPYNTTQSCQLHVYDTFWEYESTINAGAGGDQYIFNALVPKNNLTDDYADLISEFVNSSNIIADGYMAGICAILQGGKVNDKSDNYTSVTPAFRHNYFEMAMGSYWDSNSSQSITNNAIQYADSFEPKLREYGMGIYGNEENRDCIDCNWKYEFWGDHYDKFTNTCNIAARSISF